MGLARVPWSETRSSSEQSFELWSNFYNFQFNSNQDFVLNLKIDIPSIDIYTQRKYANYLAYLL